MTNKLKPETIDRLFTEYGRLYVERDDLLRARSHPGNVSEETNYYNECLRKIKHREDAIKQMIKKAIDKRPSYHLEKRRVRINR